MGPKTWFKFRRDEFDADTTLWQPLEVKIDMHDDTNLNLIYMSPDHKLILKKFKESW